MTDCANCEHDVLAHGRDGCFVGSALASTDQHCTCPFEYDSATGKFNGKGYLAGVERPDDKECRSRYRKHTGAEVTCIEAAGHEGKHKGFYNRGDQTPSTWQENESVNARPPVANPDRVKAADSQVGGEHYRQTGIQPWDVIDAWGLDFYAGNALKYLYRAGRKGARAEDLKKARHYIDKMIEKEEGGE